jgi:two-component system chemotaxis sensor kinase CheA
LPATIVNAHRSKSRFTRVPVDRLDRLSQLLSDLQVAHTDLRRQAAGPDESHWARQTELIGEINDTLRRLRMLPLDALAQRLERTVRHISDYENKLVAFVMDGGPIEVDSRVLDQLADPLLHLLRNAVSHGIEDPMVRETQGKPRQGNAAIRARIEEQHLILDVTDDGAGIDTLAIREKGIEKGFLTPDAAERMSDDELLTLIFWPGFSTAARVSEVSGRGIGLDVVQTHIHQLNGTIQVVSELGRGTTFTIRVPL